MQGPIQLDTAAVSDRGRKRSTNEDSVLCDPALGLFAIADGMGGHASGEVASRLAIDTVHQWWRQRRRPQEAPHEASVDHLNWLRESVAAANETVLQRSRSCDLFAGMGTTLIVALLHDLTLYHAHVGDSRLYRLRADRLTLLTRDHTVAQWRLDLGLCTEAEARRSVSAHRLTRAIGMEHDAGADVGFCHYEPDDWFLLCSDGLNHELDDTQIETAWRESSQLGDSADTLCRRLIERANDAGGRDNISVVAFHLGKPSDTATLHQST